MTTAAALMLLAAPAHAQDNPASPLKLWYDEPASAWNQALPVGNGRLGAMIFGGGERERIQLNEETLWSGGPYDPVGGGRIAAHEAGTYDRWREGIAERIVRLLDER